MKKIALLIGLLAITSISIAQTFSSKESLSNLTIDQKSDSLQKIYLDTLVKFVRKQFYKNDYAKTIEWGQVGLKKAKELKYNKAQFRISSLLGNAFLKVDDTLHAKRIFEDALKVAETKHDSSRSKITAIIDMGNFYALQEKSSPAIEWYREAIPLAKKNNDTTYLYILHYNVGELYLNDEEASNAAYYVEKTQEYVKNLRTPYQAGAKLLLGRYQYLTKEYLPAEINLKESIELSKEASFTDGIIQGYDLYSKAAAAQGKYQLAYTLRDEWEKYKEEKYQKDKIEAVEAATARFKINQYEQELKAQALQNEIDQAATKRKTTLLWVKIAGGILFIFFVFMFHSYLRRKKLLKILLVKNQLYLEAKEETERLSKARTELFTNITHELRTPMYGIIGTANLMMKETQPEGQKENLSSLKFSANYLLSLINNVLQLTKIETGRYEGLSKNKFNIIQLVEDVVDSCKYINEKNPNKYILSFDKELPHILIGDELKLSQILMNLVGNASKFTQKGNINITLNVLTKEEHEVQIEFTVEDTGIGIPEERQEDIFNEFSHSYVSWATEGAGLGLPIVKKLLSLHNAEISLKSEVGKGTRMQFTISYAYEAQNQEKPEILSPKDLPLKGLHILVVDDNKINQVVTKKTLENYGASITKCGSGKEAIQLVSQDEPDLILMDINMPEMNGFEATKIIRSTHPHMVVLALTAVELEKVIGDHSYELMNGYILKPFKNEIFIDTILKHTKERV